jgi:hypothetical protein
MDCRLLEKANLTASKASFKIKVEKGCGKNEILLKAQFSIEEKKPLLDLKVSTFFKILAQNLDKFWPKSIIDSKIST